MPFILRRGIRRAVVELDARLEDSDANDIWVGRQRITSLVGDSETFLQIHKTPPIFRSSYRYCWFGQEYRIGGLRECPWCTAKKDRRCSH
jgi:hypothetical protein